MSLRAKLTVPEGIVVFLSTYQKILSNVPIKSFFKVAVEDVQSTFSPLPGGYGLEEVIHLTSERSRGPPAIHQCPGAGW